MGPGLELKASKKSNSPRQSVADQSEIQRFF